MGKYNFIWKAPHHLYLGIALIIMGWLCSDYYPTTMIVCYVVGGLIALDDIIEHVFHITTPLRWFFEKYNFWLK